MTAASATAELDQASWWRRSAGGHEVLQVALPLVISNVSWTVLTFVDRVYLNWSSATAMSASLSASIVWWALLCLPLGLCMYVNTFVSQYHGDQQPEQIGTSVWQGVWVALFFSPLVLAAAPLAPTIFSFTDHGETTVRQEILYFQILCAGGPAMLLSTALSAFYGGRGKTWVMMITDSSVVVVNLVLDYLWIFGKAGFPEMGIAGAGWATVVSLWLKVLLYLLLFLQRKHREPFQVLAGLKFDRKLFGRLLYYGVPSGVQMLLDVLGWVVFVMLVGNLGQNEFTATTMAFNVSMMAFMPIVGFGIATSILVGQKLGEDRDDLAARATWTVLQIALGYMATMSILYITVPHVFLSSFFASDTISVEQQTVITTMAANLLCFVAAYNLFDAVLMVFVNALKGAGDTRYILFVSFFMAIMLASCSWLAVEVLQLSIYGCWVVAVAWVWGMGLFFLARFLTGKWRLMRVIDPHHTPHLHDQTTTTVEPSIETPSTATSVD